MVITTSITYLSFEGCFDKQRGYLIGCFGWDSRTTESLETYARIVCRCVMRTPGELLCHG
ncbi:hypothetical protein Hanom_Chr03g00272971 [Helianthus anomalus]